MSYARRTGEKPNYTKEGTARYFSQYLRWQRGMMLSPDQVQAISDDITIFRFRSRRATDGFHEVTRTKLETTPPADEGESGFSASCPISPFCMTETLQYIRYTSTTKSTIYAYVSYIDPETTKLMFGWVKRFTESSTVAYYIAPGSTANPPRDGTRIRFMGQIGPNPLPECEQSIHRSSVTFTYPNAVQSVASIQVGHGSRLYGLPSWNIYSLTEKPSPIVSPADYSSVGLEVSEYRSSGLAEFVFGNEPPFSTMRCDYGNDDDPPPPPDEEYSYSCNCPDYSQLQGVLPFSRFRSEHSDRSWVGSNTHTGTCKHIYAVKRPPAPGKTDPDENLRPPIVLDWDYSNEPPTPGPPSGDDWNVNEARAWRKRMFDRHQADWQKFWDFVRAPGNEQLAQYIDANQDFYRQAGLAYAKGQTPAERYRIKQLRKENNWKTSAPDAYEAWRKSWREARTDNAEMARMFPRGTPPRTLGTPPQPIYDASELKYIRAQRYQ